MSERMSIDWSKRLAKSKNVLARKLEGEAVLLDLETSKYFGLNAVAARFWELAEAQVALSDVRSRLLDEYDVTEADLDRDLASLVQELASRGLARLE